MRFLLFVSVVLLGIFFTACPLESADTEPGVTSNPLAGDRRPVLVELFTSEGCSSCPPADRNLAFLEKQQPVSNADIVTLAFHVDYWDRLGWKDRFSSPLFSRRQEDYSNALKLDSNYTPQMIVDGRREFVGSDSGRATKEILKATEEPKAVVSVVVKDDQIRVAITGVPAHEEATVYAAIAEDDVSTRVERGENSGKTLEHVSVVRELKTVGLLAADREAFEESVDVQKPSGGKAENLKVVVFVQENVTRKVLGVARLKL